MIPTLVVAALMLASPQAAATGGDAAGADRLTPPETGSIPVAFVITPGATVIDFTGPWEVFQDAVVPGRGTTSADTRPFRLFTVGQSREAVRASAGLQIVPDYTFADAPEPKVIVVPAQGSSPEMIAWIKKASAKADLTMSVCVGSFILAEAGLLDGRAATTHHEFLNQFAREFPNVDVRRDVRYVEGPRVATAAGLTSGVDLALRVVERYFGAQVAERTAAYMEHESDAWRARRGYWDPSTPGVVVARAPEVRPVLRGLDPVLLAGGKEVEGNASISLDREGYRYAFATEENRKRFEADPEHYAIQFKGACAFMALGGAPPGSGDPDRFVVHNGSIYIFATENCRASFVASPERYLKPQATTPGL